MIFRNTIQIILEAQYGEPVIYDYPLVSAVLVANDKRSKTGLC